MRFSFNPDDECVTVYGADGGPVNLRRGDNIEITIAADPPFVVNLYVRQPNEPFIPTIDRVGWWLDEQGVHVDRGKLIELLRIFNGDDLPITERTITS